MLHIQQSTLGCFSLLKDYPMAVVITAGRNLIVYQLEGKPQEFTRGETNLKYQHRCVAIMRDKKNSPTGLLNVVSFFML